MRGYAGVSEMAASNTTLWDSIQTAEALTIKGEVDPIAVQLLGARSRYDGSKARQSTDEQKQQK